MQITSIFDSCVQMIREDDGYKVNLLHFDEQF